MAAAGIYGATYTLLRELFVNMGVDVHFVDVVDLDIVRKTLVRIRPVALLVETISNPLTKVADLPALAEIAHTVGIEDVDDILADLVQELSFL